MPDYSEIVEQRNQAVPGPSPHVLMAFLQESQRGAAVLDELLDSPAWNIFRSNLLGAAQMDEAERLTVREQIETGSLVGDERSKADLRLQYLRGRLEALQIALDLPKTLIGKHARLAKVVATNGDTRGGLERPQQEAHNLHEAGSTPARATTGVAYRKRKRKPRR